MKFYEGAPFVDFMNDTIVAKSQTIASMLSEDEASVDRADMNGILIFNSMADKG